MAALTSRGLHLLGGVGLGGDGRFYPNFETEADYTEPEQHIAAMLDAIESLAEPLREVWVKCASREFNIGYDCGLEPWAFNQQLSAVVLGRMAVAGASLRITIYPDRECSTPTPTPCDTPFAPGGSVPAGS